MALVQESAAKVFFEPVQVWVAALAQSVVVEASARQVEGPAWVSLVATVGYSASLFSVCRRHWLNWSTMP